MIDWSSLERAAKVVAGPGPRIDGARLLDLRSQIVGIVDEASRRGRARVADSHRSRRPSSSSSTATAGSAATSGRCPSSLGDIDVKGAESKLLAWEGGGFVGLLARIVLGQYDPFRDQLLDRLPEPRRDVRRRRPALAALPRGDARRAVPRRAVDHRPHRRRRRDKRCRSKQPGFARDVVRQLPERLPELHRWARDALEGKATTTPLFELLPDEQREAIMGVHALVTLLEGHATHVTELIAKRVLPEATRRSTARSPRAGNVRRSCGSSKRSPASR